MSRGSVGRAVLVVDEQPYLWAVLRQRVEPATAYVRGATPGELATAWGSCRPWPWLVVGATPAEPPGLAALLADRPIAVHWLGDPPAALAARAVAHADWTALAAELARLSELAGAGVNGVRLMRNRGLCVPEGRLVLDVPHVEGLLAAPNGLPGGGGSAALVAAARAEIETHGLPLRVVLEDGRVRLTAAPHEYRMRGSTYA